MTRSELGDGVTLEHQVRDANGVLVDASVVFTVTAPSGVITTPTVEHVSTGRYRTALLPNELNDWIYVVTTSGAVNSVKYGQFTVVPPAFIPPPDRLAEVSDLLRMPGVPAGFDRDSAGLLLEVATAVVQAAAGGQRILLVVDDRITCYGGADSVLTLPQRPIVEVTSVDYDGSPLTQGGNGWRRAPGGIWRECGWGGYPGTRPVPTDVVYTHGYAEGRQELQLARTATLSLAKEVAKNPKGLTRRAIDDYQEAYDATRAALDSSPSLARALRKQYGRPAGTVRV